jgi:hypothetical protein
MNTENCSFGNALIKMTNEGVAMTRMQFGKNIYCRVQKPDENSLNTIPYIQMVKKISGAATFDEDKIERFPVTLSPESMFATDWYVIEPDFK